MERGHFFPIAGVFLFALAYLLLLRPYGFQLEDEGTLLLWFDRVLRGQQPYLDFHTGYTPGFFAFGHAVFASFGPSATALRAVLVVINALSAAGLTAATCRVAGPWLAPIPALLWLAFMPVMAGEFAAFNVPYPTWPVTLAWISLALVMLQWVEKPRIALLMLAGALCAIAMWFRPNSGAYALAATTWIVVAAAPRTGAIDRVAAPLAAAFMAAGIWYSFQFQLFGVDVGVHLVPAFALTLLMAGPLAKRFEGRTAADGEAAPAARSLVVLAVAFLVPTLAWAWPLWTTLGRERFLYEVFLVGADYQTLYYKTHPAPEPIALLVLAGVVAAAIAGRLVARRGVRALLILLGLGAAAGVAKLFVFQRMVAPEGFVWSIVAQLENASFWLAALTSFGCVAWLWRVPSQALQASPRARALLVAAPLGVAMYLQMYPRSDFMHQVSAVPLMAVAACGLLDRVVVWWGRGNWPASWNGDLVVRSKVLAAALVVALLGFSGKVRGPIEALQTASPQTAMPERLDVRVERAAGDELEAISRSVAFLRATIVAGEPVWSFPATGGLLFAAGATNLAPHDYWYPGRPDRAEEARVLALLQQQRPRFVVTLNKGWNFFAGSPAYFENLRAFVTREYRLAARFGRYDVLARSDVEVSNPSSGSEALAAPGAGSGALDAAIEPNLERRRQAAWRWMDAMSAEESAAARLPADRHDAILLLRAIRDGGDLRAAGWMLAGMDSPDARIRREAADAMLATTLELGARRARFANDFDPSAWRAFVAPWAARARPLLEDERLRPFAAAVVEIAGSPS